MNNKAITRILFDDDTVLRVFSETDIDINDDSLIQKAADSMLANSSDVGEMSEDEQNEHMLAAAGLPKDLLYREMPYIRNDELCSYIKLRLANKYRIGLLATDKISAKLALGDGYANIFDDILTADELPDNLRYFFDDALIVSASGDGFSEVFGTSRTHKYSTTNDLARYLASPPPFVAPVQEGNGVAKSVGKNAASALPLLRNTPKSVQYFVDFAIVAGLGVIAASIFPNEFSAIVEQLKKVISWG